MTREYGCVFVSILNLLKYQKKTYSHIRLIFHDCIYALMIIPRTSCLAEEGKELKECSVIIATFDQNNYVRCSMVRVPQEQHRQKPHRLVE